MKKWLLELVVLIVLAIIFLGIFGTGWKSILAFCIGIAIVHLISYPVMKSIEVKEIDKMK